MMLIRPLCNADFEALLTLTADIPGGMTSLPHDRDILESKLALAEKSFAGETGAGEEALFFLVLEDTDTGIIAGTAALHAGIGLNRPFYNYRLSRHVRSSRELGITVTRRMLNLVNDFTGDTELGSMYIRPEYRKHGLGKVLSLSRFAVMYDFPEKFEGRVFAEIRGWLTKEGESPLWKHLGSKFFTLSFQEADRINAVSGWQFISDLMPPQPVYLALLPKEAVKVIGVPHVEARSAMKFLLNAGFRHQGAVDIFDGGPVVECEREHITVLKQCQDLPLVELSRKPLADSTALAIVSNKRLPDYRLAQVRVEYKKGGVVLSATDAELLGLEEGDILQAMDGHTEGNRHDGYNR